MTISSNILAENGHQGDTSKFQKLYYSYITY